MYTHAHTHPCTHAHTHHSDPALLKRQPAVHMVMGHKIVMEWGGYLKTKKKRYVTLVFSIQNMHANESNKIFIIHHHNSRWLFSQIKHIMVAIGYCVAPGPIQYFIYCIEIIMADNELSI